jgi:hypothetical protein
MERFKEDGRHFIRVKFWKNPSATAVMSLTVETRLPSEAYASVLRRYPNAVIFEEGGTRPARRRPFRALNTMMASLIYD